jgi:hypothetical protein
MVAILFSTTIAARQEGYFYTATTSLRTYLFPDYEGITFRIIMHYLLTCQVGAKQVSSGMFKAPPSKKL